MIYFDSAATSFHKPSCVAEAVAASFHTLGNAGRGAHAPTLTASRIFYDTRVKMAELFHIEEPSQIAFCSNVTEALNMAAEGLIGPGDRVITSVCEHNSVLRPLFRKREEGVELVIIGADEKGRLDLAQLEAELAKASTKAVFLAHASNITGNVVNLKKVAALAHEAGAFLVVDAAQTAGAIPIDVAETSMDILCFTGHKSLLGPQGTGGIYVRDGIVFPSFKVGGSGFDSFNPKHPTRMPELLEAGTQNGHGIAGLNAGVNYLLDKGIDAIEEKERELAVYFAAEAAKIPGIKLYGDYDAVRRAPIVSLNLRDADSAEISDILWEDYEICVRPGAHCAPLMHKHFGTADQGIVRFSFSFMNTREEVETALQALRELSDDFAEEQQQGI